jgi:predicted secreted protein
MKIWLLLTLLVLTCINSAKIMPTPGSDVLVFDNLKDNSKISLSVGKSIDILIKGNPTTGYGWYLDNVEEINKEVLYPLNLTKENSSKNFVTNEHPKGFVGVGGNYHFLFNGVGPGTVKLVFVYKRPWETKPINKLRYTVEVT